MIGSDSALQSVNIRKSSPSKLVNIAPTREQLLFNRFILQFRIIDCTGYDSMAPRASEGP